jgi:hypothetical protein
MSSSCFYFRISTSLLNRESSSHIDPASIETKRRLKQRWNSKSSYLWNALANLKWSKRCENPTCCNRRVMAPDWKVEDFCSSFVCLTNIYLTDALPLCTKIFLMLPLSVAAGGSTMIASSSLLTLLAAVFAGVGNPSVSSSFRNSFLIESLRFSHHSFSDSVFAWISSSRFRKTVFAAISFADWKIV